MGSKSKLARKSKPSTHFAPSDPDMSCGKLKPGTMLASMNFSEYNRNVQPHARLSPGSYVVGAWTQEINVGTEKAPVIHEHTVTFFKHTSGPNEGSLIPRDYTVKVKGETLSFEDLGDSSPVGTAAPSMRGVNFASEKWAA